MPESASTPKTDRPIPSELLQKLGIFYYRWDFHPANPDLIERSQGFSELTGRTTERSHWKTQWTVRPDFRYRGASKLVPPKLIRFQHGRQLAFHRLHCNRQEDPQPKEGQPNQQDFPTHQRVKAGVGSFSVE